MVVEVIPYQSQFGQLLTVYAGNEGTINHPDAQIVGLSIAGGPTISENVMLTGLAATVFLDFFHPEAISDIRLKDDIVKLDRLANGLGLYRFRYKWSDEHYVGVMAQEVQKVVPGAVVGGADGYLRVNYARLGLKFMKWDTWVAQQAA